MKKFLIIACLSIMAPQIVQAQEYTDEEVYNNVFGLVKDNYILYQSADMEKMAINGIKGLSKLDKNVKIGNDNSRVSLYYKGILKRSKLKPEDRENIEGWNKLNQDMIEEVKKISPHMKKYDFEILDNILETAINESLDKASKYYPEGQSEEVVNQGVKRSFTASMQENILYIKISSFNKYTAKNLEETLKTHKTYEGVILDLRGSVGGELSEALKVADTFLSGGIMIMEGKDKNNLTYYHADEEDKTEDKPLVILIDGATTSAAELVASALQSQSRGKLVGTTTYGKGSKQELYELPNGAVLGLTRGYFYTAGEEAIDKKGIKPDICTYGQTEIGNMEKYVSQKIQGICKREGRENQAIDMEVAKYIIDSQL